MVLEKKQTKASPQLIEVIRNSGIAIIPCDTIYGIVGSYPLTSGRICEIKRRDVSKQLIVLIKHADQLTEFTESTVIDEIKALWPGPLTLIVPTRAGRTIGFRVPDDKYLIDLIDMCGPVFSTSVNRSGEPAMHVVESIRREFMNEVDILVDGGVLPESPPSTVLDISSVPYRILRRGACALPDDLPVEIV